MKLLPDGEEDQVKKELNRLIKENVSAKKTAHITQIFLKNITEALPQYVFWKDTNSVYLGCNKNYAQLVGFPSPEAIIGKTDQDIGWQPAGHTTEDFQKGDKDTISGHPITNQEEILSLPNGKTLVTLLSKLPIVDHGQVLGIVGYFTDITELKNKEKELTKAKQLAEAANQAKSLFITNISHDLRTPLTGMIGMARIILKELRNKSGQEAASNLVKAADALLDLLNEVIEITKLDAGSLPVYEVKFSMRKLLDHLIHLVTPSVQEKKLALVVDYDQNLPNYVIGDQTRIHRILLNLVSNAIKFTDQGKIAITFKATKKQAKSFILEITVADTGMGVPFEKQEIIFSKFTRLDPSYKGNYKGSGLGLFIVKQFITEIEGEIYVDSIKDEGSTFTCLIPLKEALVDEPKHVTELDPNAAANGAYKYFNMASDDSNYLDEASNNSSPKEKSLAKESDSIKILLVEDNKIAQMAAKRLLEDCNCLVETADTGEQALEMFKSRPYNFVFMDIGLPGKNGCEVTQEIREWEKINQQHTPIVALTAHVDDNSKQQCLAAGMEQVLHKPLKEAAAIKVLQTYVPGLKNYLFEDNSGIALTSKMSKSIDLEMGAKIFDGNKESAREMLKILVDSLPDAKDKLEYFYGKKQWKELQFEVHKLHGGTFYCGVPRLKAILNKLLEDLKIERFSHVNHGFNDLLEEIQQVLQEYTHL